VRPDQRKPVPGAYGAEMLTQRGVLGVVAGHQNRHLVIDPKSGALYVEVGSVGNVGVEPDLKATIRRFDPDGSDQSTVVSDTPKTYALRQLNRLVAPSARATCGDNQGLTRRPIFRRIA
jgi:hypothetical protein